MSAGIETTLDDMTALRHAGPPCLVAGASSDEDINCSCQEAVQLFDMSVVVFIEKKMRVPGYVSYCDVEGGLWIVYILEKFWDMLVRFQSLETVSDKSAINRVLSRLTIGPTDDRSIRIIE